MEDGSILEVDTGIEDIALRKEQKGTHSRLQSLCCSCIQIARLRLKPLICRRHLLWENQD